MAQRNLRFVRFTLKDALLKLRDDVSGRRDLGSSRDQLIRESNRLVSEAVNEFFRDRLLLMPEVRLYLQDLTGATL